MFGKNEIMKVAHREDGALDVHSIFYTIQGEGPFAGRAAAFVRLHGCSLACSWCDTEFEATRQTLQPQDLLDRVAATVPHHAPRPLVVITGGEPMRQRLTPFVQAARDAGYATQIETAGIHWEPELLPLLDPERGLSIVCSPKTPVVKEGIERQALAFKYIVDDLEAHSPVDGLPALAVSQRGAAAHGLLFRPAWLSNRPRAIYVQPLDPPSSPRLTTAEAREAQRRRNRDRCVFLTKQYGYQLSLQQHKILDLP